MCVKKGPFGLLKYLPTYTYYGPVYESIKLKSSRNKFKTVPSSQNNKTKVGR